MLDSFSCGCASAAADHSTCGHACSGSDGTADDGTGYATGSCPNGGSDGHARDVISQVARAIWVVFGFKFIKNIDDRVLDR
jgi:hypothetical protein